MDSRSDRDRGRRDDRRGYRRDLRDGGRRDLPSQDRNRDKDSRDRRDDRAPPRSSYRDSRDDRGRDGTHGRSPLPSKNRYDRDRTRSPLSESKGNSDRNDFRQRSPPRGPRSTTARNGPPPSTKPRDKAVPQPKVISNTIAHGDVSMEDDLETLMTQIMGFTNFKSTKNTKVPGNDKLYCVRKEKKTQYRQYMNRKGGFNRPLSPQRQG